MDSQDLDQQLRHLLDGLAMGLTRFFASEIRVATIVQLAQECKPMFLGHPQLYEDYVSILSSWFRSDDSWRSTSAELEGYLIGQGIEAGGPQVDGLTSYACQSRSVYRQAWFATEHPSQCSTEPVRQFLDQAAVHVRTIAAVSPEAPDLDLSLRLGFELEGFELHAVRQAIRARYRSLFRAEMLLPLQEILRALEGISEAHEEGARASGTIAFLQADALTDLTFAHFNQAHPIHLGPHSRHHKRVCKMLYSTSPMRPEESTQVKSSLISDGKTIVGLLAGDLPEASLVARFRRGRAVVELISPELQSLPICSLIDGRFNGRKLKRDASILDANFRKIMTDGGCVFKTTEDCSRMAEALEPVVRSAQDLRHGCILVIDANLPGTLANYSGEKFTEPLDVLEHAAIVAGMARIDGALVLGLDGKVNAAACLLDGAALPTEEDRSHGARHNSALRFTNTHEDTVAVVVSEDGPISFYAQGRGITREIVSATTPSAEPISCFLDVV